MFALSWVLWTLLADAAPEPTVVESHTVTVLLVVAGALVAAIAITSLLALRRMRRRRSEREGSQ